MPFILRVSLHWYIQKVCRVVAGHRITDHKNYDFIESEEN